MLYLVVGVWGRGGGCGEVLCCVVAWLKSARPRHESTRVAPSEASGRRARQRPARLPNVEAESPTGSGGGEGASSDGRETTEARAGAGARNVRAHSSASIPTRPLTARSSGCARRGKVTWRRARGPGDGLLSPPATTDRRLLLPTTRRCLGAPALYWVVRDGLNSAAFLVDALVGSSRPAQVEAERTGSREVCWRFLEGEKIFPSGLSLCTGTASRCDKVLDVNYLFLCRGLAAQVAKHDANLVFWGLFLFVCLNFLFLFFCIAFLHSFVQCIDETSRITACILSHVHFLSNQRTWKSTASTQLPWQFTSQDDLMFIYGPVASLRSAILSS